MAVVYIVEMLLRRPGILFVCILFSPIFGSAQKDPLRPHSEFEPPLAKAASSLVESRMHVPDEWLTTGERTGWRETGIYAEVLRLARHMEKTSPFVKVLPFGTTPEGREMEAIIVSADRAFTPAAAKRTKKAVILIQSGIHSGEIEGKDTALMLVRDMTITKRSEQAKWLTKAIFVVIPVFNIDGHESRSAFNRPNQNGPQIQGTRGNALQLNLNRDYIKAATPEMRAWLKLFNSWEPDFMFDNHVTDGADYQYDLTWGMAHNQDIGQPVRTWVNQRFLPELDRRMTAKGHLMSPYGALRKGADGRREFFEEVFSPRYSHLYAAVQNRPALLVETHSLKEAKTRAWANYDVMKESIDIALQDPDALRAAIQEANAQEAAMAGNQTASPIYLGGKTSGESRPFVYRSLKSMPFQSEITGSMVNRFTSEKEDVETVIHGSIDTVAEARMPAGYLVPRAWKEVADQLALHGIVVEKTLKPIEQEFDTYRFSDVKFASAAFEGGLLADYSVTPVRERIAVPAGSYWIPMHQSRARLILALLEPAAPDALVRWGFFNSIFQQLGRISAGEYLAEPIAARMAVEQPALWASFQQKLRTDTEFAADPQARLRWWTAQSSYQSPASNRYPVLKVWEKSW